MEMKNNHIAIIGGGLGGLSAAIHLRLAGHPVTLYEANERVGGRANLLIRSGFRFDTGPSLLNYPWVYEELFRAAGKRFSDYVRLLPVDPSVSFQWRDGTTFTLSSRLDRLLEETERIEPGSRPAVLEFLGDAAAKYSLAFDKLISDNEDSPLRWLGKLTLREFLNMRLWRSLDGELGRYFSSRYLREALGSYAMYLGGSPYDLPGLFSILPYGELAYGLWLPKGGMYGLVEGIERLAREIGVEIHTGRRVMRIDTAGGRVKGLTFEDGTSVHAMIVISNVDAPTTDRELVRSDASLNGRSPRMTSGVLTMYLGIRGQIKTLGHHTIFLPQNYRGTFDDLFKHGRMPADIPFYVSIPSATDPDLAPPGDTTMFVLVPTPLVSELGPVAWESYVREIRDKIIRRLREHGTVIRPEMFAVEEYYTPPDWQKKFGLFDGSAFGAAHTLSQVGPFRQRNYSRRVKGLFYVGASTTPGTGVPMVVLGGKLTAMRILSHVCEAVR